MDSIMLGSLTLYRRILHENVFSKSSVPPLGLTAKEQVEQANERAGEKLPTLGHAIAGVMAGATVSFIAAPVEHIKARLQVQYAVDRSKRLYRGPIDCFSKIVKPTICYNFSELIERVAVPHPRHSRHLPRPHSDPPFPLLLLLLVGLLRHLHAPPHKSHIPFYTRHQLLGRRPQRSGLLDNVVPIRHRKTAHHDRWSR